MIECLKIEDFVITQMFRPYMPSICSGDYQKKIELKLRSNPEHIIEILEKDQETKQRIFNRLRKCGGVKFYQYLDMSNPVIQYVKKGLEDILKERDND